MRQLSGGMKRRVLVAQALVHRPPVIVLDEPTAGVDVELRQTLWQFVARLNKEGHTVLLTTHYLEEAEALCRRIAMLKQGRVVALDRTSALLAGTASTMLRFKMDHGLAARAGGAVARHRAHRAGEGARRGRGRDHPRRAARRRRASPKTWRSAAPTWRTCSSTSCRGTPMNGWRHAALRKGSAALLEGQLPDRGGAGAHRGAVPADLRPRAGGSRQVYDRIGYTSFLIPGLVMMSVLQNAFANSSPRSSRARSPATSSSCW